jgi:hypothetical protein
VEKTGKKRPWKSLRDFHFSHSFNNNKLDDRDHFQQNAKTSVASLRGLIGPSRNTDRHQSGMLIDFIGIPTRHSNVRIAATRARTSEMIWLIYPDDWVQFSVCRIAGISSSLMAFSFQGSTRFVEIDAIPGASRVRQVRYPPKVRLPCSPLGLKETDF